eukprot:TRINITY_DN112_c0_g1_i7.p1 TRINITY_DN112_c0_g1~~TRINITY_DN112_c0_g1_i7.p1  ORF type:complete len:147 (+),score=36.81 TRINITY_DN112_c0_g1_i7:49-441(+)
MRPTFAGPQSSTANYSSSTDPGKLVGAGTSGGFRRVGNASGPQSSHVNGPQSSHVNTLTSSLPRTPENIKPLDKTPEDSEEYNKLADLNHLTLTSLLPKTLENIKALVKTPEDSEEYKMHLVLNHLMLTS